MSGGDLTKDVIVRDDTAGMTWYREGNVAASALGLHVAEQREAADLRQ